MKRYGLIKFMSEIFIVDLGQHNLSFDELDLLSKKIVALALKNDIGVFFHSFDYGTNIIESGGMKNFFLMSDSFLYKNCGFLDTTMFNVPDFKFKKSFMKKYKFIDKILAEIKRAHIKSVDIYISTDGSVENVSDFVEKNVCKKDFLQKMFFDILEYADIFAYSFPTVKYKIDLS